LTGILLDDNILKITNKEEVVVMEELKFSVIGAGAGGQSFAAILSNMGYCVKLHDNNKEIVDKLNELKKIKITGAIEVESFPELVTSNLQDALDNVDIILIVSTTDAHASIARGIKDYIKNGQIIILNPGHIGGALEVSSILRDKKIYENLIIAEAADLLYACRTIETGHIFHSGIKKSAKIATIPANDIEKLLNKINPIFPQFILAENVLQTSFNAGGALLHPIPTALNMNKIDHKIEFDYYMEGITVNIARIIEKADEERLKIANALRLSLSSLKDNLKTIYGLEGKDLYTLLQNNKAYIGVKSPKDFMHRFILEDTLNGLVPLSSFGDFLNIDTPVIDAFIEICSIVTGRDLKSEGRTMEKLGLSGKTWDEIYELIN